MATDDEREAITSHLLDYADQNEFEPLAACDYGSRARNLASDSSDYDAFFIFAQSPSDYALGADTETYTTEIDAEDSRLDTEIELHGWNLQRFIGNDGLLGSNPTAVEFCASDEQYFMDETAEPYFEAMIEHTRSEFKPYALMNHYRSLSASNYGKYIEGDYKLTSDTSYGDLLYPADPSWGAISHDSTNHLSVDEEETEIGEDRIEVVGHLDWHTHLGFIDTDEALERGLIEPTTTDRTNKRYLNICQALLKSRYIETTHECPPMDADELLRWAAGSDWLPEETYARIGDLMVQKTQRGGVETGLNPNIDEWIEAELGREIEIEPHVQRQPSTAQIRGAARDLYDTIDW